GPGFDLAELAAVVDQPVISLWQPVGEALAAGLLTDAGGQLAFRHEVVRRVLAGDVAPGVAAGLYERAARSLAAAGAPPERVARYLAAGTGLAADWYDWLDRHTEALVARVPALAADLLRRADRPEALARAY